MSSTFVMHLPTQPATAALRPPPPIHQESSCSAAPADSPSASETLGPPSERGLPPAYNGAQEAGGSFAFVLPLYQSNSAITLYPPPYREARHTQLIVRGPPLVPESVSAHQDAWAQATLRLLSYGCGSVAVLAAAGGVSGALGYVTRGAVAHAEDLTHSLVDLIKSGAIGGAILGTGLMVVLQGPNCAWQVFENTTPSMRLREQGVRAISSGTFEAFCGSLALNFLSVGVGAAVLEAIHKSLSAPHNKLWAAGALGALLCSTLQLVVGMALRTQARRVR